MPDVIIRSANALDREAVLRLDALLEGVGADVRLLDLTDEQLEFIDSRGPAAGMHLLVAVQNEAVVGFAFATLRAVASGMVDRASSILLLRRIAVEPSARRAGVGRELLAELERRVARDPRSMLQAHVPASAKGFYEAEGWTILEPHEALAWIEVPSIAVWEAARLDGFDPGPRRKIAMLRTEDPTADAETGYDRVAFKVLRQDLVVEQFPFLYGSTSNSLRDAMTLIADQIVADPARRKNLPPDVSKLIFDMVLVPELGATKANQLRRS